MNRDQLIERMFAVFHRFGQIRKDRFQSTLGEEKLTPQQMETLFHIKHFQPLSGRGFATRMRLSPSAATQAVDSLVRHGLVERTSDNEDRRAVLLRLTAAGEAKAKAMAERRRLFFIEMTEGLSDEELATLVGLQEKIIAHLDETRGSTGEE